MITADAADREHSAGTQDLHRGGHCRRVARDARAPRFDERQVRPADRTRHRLGVETAIERVLVLATARGAQRESRHAGVCTVVGQRLDQRVARAALRAVDERIAVAAIGRIGELRHAIVAGEEVGRHRHLRRVGGAAGRDLEPATGRFVAGRDVANPGLRERRRSIDESAREGFDGGQLARHDNFDVAAQVAHETVERRS